MQRDLQKLKDRKNEEQQNEGDCFLSADLALLMHEVPLIEKVVCGDLPFTSEVKEILQEQCLKLGLDAGKMEQELQAAMECDGFLLSNDMSPTGRVMSFMYSKKLGPAARGLYNALKLNQALTDEQKTLLEKICIKMGQAGWFEAILGGIEEDQAARVQEHAQYSPATNDKLLPGQGLRIPGDQ